MDKQIVAEYLTKLKKNSGLTYDEIGKKCNRSESTVKKLCLGETEDPRVSTVAPVVYALDGSMDEMLYPDKYKKKSEEPSVVASSDITEPYKELVTYLKAECKHAKLVAWAFGIVLVSLLIAEVMNPNLGWIRW